MDYRKYVAALRHCDQSRNATDCDVCPFGNDGEACDSVGMLGAAAVIEELAEQLEQERVRNRWVPAAERLPEPGEDVLVCCQSKRLAPWQSVAHLDTEDGEWLSDEEGVLYGEVTHWRGLPEYPNG